MALLDGRVVAAEVIDPSKHRYIGMWRAPFHVPHGVVACSCGQMLQTFEQTREHYQAGHFDEPQYQTIQREA